MCVRSCWLVQRECEKKWMPEPRRKIGVGLVRRLLTQSIARGVGGFYSSKTPQLQYLLEEDWRKSKLLCNRHKHTHTHPSRKHIKQSTHNKDASLNAWTVTPHTFLPCTYSSVHTHTNVTEKVLSNAALTDSSFGAFPWKCHSRQVDMIHLS